MTPPSSPDSEPEIAFDVECLLDHKLCDGQYRFLVRWLGYGVEYDTWESLTNLSCRDKMVNYIQKNGLSESILDDMVEDCDEDANVVKLSDPVDRPLDPNECVNGLTIFQTVDEVARLRDQYRQYSDSTLRVLHSYRKKPTDDAIIHLTYHYHAYVVYYRPGRISFYCDGANASLEPRRGLQKYFARRFGNCRPLAYEGQLLDDHCGSSAILIALEFLRLSKQPEQLDSLEQIRGCTSLRDMLIKRWHPEASPNLNTWKPIQDFHQDTCGKCGVSFAKRPLRSRKQVKMNHERACNGDVKTTNKRSVNYVCDKID